MGSSCQSRSPDCPRWAPAGAGPRAGYAPRRAPTPHLWIGLALRLARPHAIYLTCPPLLCCVGAAGLPLTRIRRVLCCLQAQSQRRAEERRFKHTTADLCCALPMPLSTCRSSRGSTLVPPLSAVQVHVLRLLHAKRRRLLRHHHPLLFLPPLLPRIRFRAGGSACRALSNRPIAAPLGIIVAPSDSSQTPLGPLSDPSQTPLGPLSDPSQTPLRPLSDPSQTPLGPLSDPSRTRL